MLLIKAEQRHSRQSPRKVRLAADAIRGMSLQKALAQLSVIETKGSVVLLKVMRQAVANAVNNLGLKVADLEIHEVIVNRGTSYKRFRAASRGRASTLLKPTSHVKIVLKSTVEPTIKAENKKASKKATDAKKEVKTADKSEEAKVNETEVRQAIADNKAIDKTAIARQTNKPMASRMQPVKKTVNRTTSK